MKLLSLTGLLFIGFHSAAQNPYAKLNNLAPELRNMFDPLPIDAAPVTHYFAYAQKLQQQDSLKKAAMLFDRIYWKDTASEMGLIALKLRHAIEEKILTETNKNFFSTWEWLGTSNGWTTSNHVKAGQHNAIAIQKDRMQFFLNDTLIRETVCAIIPQFNWLSGNLTYTVRFPDDELPWYYILNTPYGFTSNSLIGQRHSDYTHSGTEMYKRKPEWKKKKFD